MINSKKKIWFLLTVTILIVVVIVITLITYKQQKISTTTKNNTENSHLVVLKGGTSTLSTTTLQSTQSLLYNQVKNDITNPNLFYTGTIRPNSYVQLNENEAQLLVDIPSINATYIVDISSIDSSSGSIVNIICPSISQLAHKWFVCHAP